jgi:hypothetical protein
MAIQIWKIMGFLLDLTAIFGVATDGIDESGPPRRALPHVRNRAQWRAYVALWPNYLSYCAKGLKIKGNLAICGVGDGRKR